MRINSLAQAGLVALALTAGLTAVAPAFAAPANQAQTQAQQASKTGPYDGAWFEASKKAGGNN